MRWSWVAAALALPLACGAGDGPSATTEATAPATETTASTTTQGSVGGSDPAIGPLPEELSWAGEWFDRHASVFGVHILATPATGDDAVGHAALVLAGYLDNDGDGVADDPAVMTAMNERGATLIMPYDEREAEQLIDSIDFDLLEAAGLTVVQDLHAVETAPRRGFDGALEEVHHLVFDAGWSVVYPESLDPEGSRLTDAMDLARGGHFTSVPSAYPAGAWYHYDDETCEYECMVSEYVYWAHTTLLGIQDDPERCEDIAIEWKPCSAVQLRTTDPAVVAVLEDPALGLPSRDPRTVDR